MNQILIGKNIFNFIQSCVYSLASNGTRGAALNTLNEPSGILVDDSGNICVYQVDAIIEVYSGSTVLCPVRLSLA
jgi:hypothetical protein